MKDFLDKNVAIYARVSTTRQAENDVSIPDQTARCEAFATDKGGTVVETYIEPGASATTTSRPVYQKMLADARAGNFSVIVAFSLSRLFRNALDYMKARAELRSAGVKLVSVTQDFADDPSGELALSMVALFDEYQSAENAKHVKRTMVANAKAGYWNGQKPPIGFKVVSVPQPKGKDRKKLEIDEDRAYLPRFIFETYVFGTAEGPIGIAKLADLLNKRGETLDGRRFHVSNVHAILTNTAYCGCAFFNKRDSRAKKMRPESEWVPIPVPAIIEEDLFYQAQAQMAARDPKMGANAAKTNANLLTGKVTCGTTSKDGCRGGMTTATGKSGQHKYYACNTRKTAGKTQCKGRWTNMKVLDDLVVENVIEHVLQPQRLSSLLSAWLEHSSQSEARDRAELKSLRARLTMLDGESANVIGLVRKGLMSADDKQIEKELGEIAAQKRAVAADIDIHQRKLADPARAITPDILVRFSKLVGSTMRDRASPLRKQYVDLLVDKVEVGDTLVRITGRKSCLARAANSTAPHMVPKAEREWCTRQDSNLWPLPSEGSALSS